MIDGYSRSGMSSVRPISDAIRSARKAQGLRQEELAAAAGVGIRFIVDIEAAKPTAQIGKVLQVAQALGLELTLTPKARS